MGNKKSKPPQRTVEIIMVSGYKNGSRCKVGASCLGGRFFRDLYPCEIPLYSFRIPNHSTKRKIFLDDEEVTVELCDDHGIEPEILVDYAISRPHLAGIAFLYDTTSHSSWEQLRILMDYLLHSAQSYINFARRCKFSVLGCKCDLVEEREVDITTVRTFADQNDMLCVETSAKENINVDYAFVSFASQLLALHH